MRPPTKPPAPVTSTVRWLDIGQDPGRVVPGLVHRRSPLIARVDDRDRRPDVTCRNDRLLASFDHADEVGEELAREVAPLANSVGLDPPGLPARVAVGEGRGLVHPSLDRATRTRDAIRVRKLAEPREPNASV